MSKDQRQASDDRQLDPLPRTWADGDDEVAAHLSYAAPAINPIQYGPLTAQGNYVSEMDWPRVPTLPAQPISDLDPELPGPPYSIAADGDRLPAHAWLATGEPPLAATQYDLYRQMINAQYQNQAFLDASLVGAGVHLSSDFPGEPLPQSTYSPYDGIWAFNPLAVDDNFVYPPNLPPPESYKPEATQPLSADMASSSLHATALSPRELALNFAATSSMMSQAFPASAPVVPPVVNPHTPASATNPAPPATSNERPPAVKSSRPERVKRNRAGQAQAVVPRRQGPLSTAQRQKADDMRYYGACWRCRRYKKPVSSLLHCLHSACC